MGGSELFYAAKRHKQVHNIRNEVCIYALP